MTYGIDSANILTRGTPIYCHDPGVGSRFDVRRGMRHVATVVRPMRDYGRNTASYYEVKLWDGRERVYSADFIEIRHEGRDARSFDNNNTNR